MCDFCLPPTQKLGARNRGQVQRLSSCRAALHLAKSLLFTDASMKMGTLPVTEHQMAAGQPTTVFFSTFFLACAASLLIGIIFSAGFLEKMILKNPA